MPPADKCLSYYSQDQPDSSNYNMKQLGIFEIKNKFPEFCEEVAVHGDRLVVTGHGKPIVRIVPYEETANQSSSPIWASVKECQEQ